MRDKGFFLTSFVLMLLLILTLLGEATEYAASSTSVSTITETYPNPAVSSNAKISGVEVVDKPFSQCNPSCTQTYQIVVSNPYYNKPGYTDSADGSKYKIRVNGLTKTAMTYERLTPGRCSAGRCTTDQWVEISYGFSFSSFEYVKTPVDSLYQSFNSVSISDEFSANPIVEATHKLNGDKIEITFKVTVRPNQNWQPPNDVYQTRKKSDKVSIDKPGVVQVEYNGQKRCECQGKGLCMAPGNTFKKCDGCNAVSVQGVEENCYDNSDNDCDGRIDESCANKPCDLSGKTCQGTVFNPYDCIHDFCRYTGSIKYYCGDNYCDTYFNENDINCQQDCKNKGDGMPCNLGAECKSSQCKVGKCITLKTDGQQCASASECFGNYCINKFCSSMKFYCGDKVCDSTYESSDGSGTYSISSGLTKKIYPKATCPQDCKIALKNSETCTSAANCLSNYCKLGQCSPYKAAGQPCSQTYECKDYCVHSKCSTYNYADNDGFCDTGEPYYNNDCKKKSGEKCTQETTSYLKSSNECKTNYCRKTNNNDLICTDSFYYYCGDGYCNINYESYASSAGKAACPADCKCGNGQIEAGETISTCPADACTAALTNTNSQCCAAKGGCFDSTSTCRYGQLTKETSCADNIDNDCDGKKDINDEDCCNPSVNTLVDSTAYGGVKRCVPKAEISALDQNLPAASLCAWGSVVQKRSSAGGKENDKGGNSCTDNTDNDCDGKKDINDEDCCSGVLKNMKINPSSSIPWFNAASKGCCAVGDCVDKNGACKSSGTGHTTLNQNGNDNKAYCNYYAQNDYYSGWIDCDSFVNKCGSSICGASANVYTGETQLHGEYTAAQKSGCCGDDANEYYANLCPGVTSQARKCCDSPSDKIDKNGNCITACQKLDGEQCASQSECLNGFCVKVPGSASGKCSNSAVICGDGYCDTPEKTACAADCCQDGDASQFCCTAKAGEYLNNECCGDDTEDSGKFITVSGVKYYCGYKQQGCLAKWYNSFSNRNGCLAGCEAAGFKIADGGEEYLKNFGGYRPGKELGDCCGDDLKEFYTTTKDKSRCCNVQTDCVDSQGNCQKGTELCGNGADDDCDGLSDNIDPDCCADGDSDSNCCKQQGGAWLETGNTQNLRCCGDDTNDYGSILTYSSKQYLCASTIVADTGETVKSWIDAAGKKAEITIFQKIGQKGKAFGDALKNAISAVKTEKPKKEQDVVQRQFTTKQEEENKRGRRE